MHAGVLHAWACRSKGRFQHACRGIYRRDARRRRPASRQAAPAPHMPQAAAAAAGEAELPPPAEASTADATAVAGHTIWPELQIPLPVPAAAAVAALTCTAAPAAAAVRQRAALLAGPGCQRVLFGAALWDAAPLVAAALAAGASLGGRTAGGQTALHLAAAAGSCRALEALLAAGADAVAGDEQAWQAIHYASQVRGVQGQQGRAGSRGCLMRPWGLQGHSSMASPHSSARPILVSTHCMPESWFGGLALPGTKCISELPY